MSNKDADYLDMDVKQLTLFMNFVWKRAEDHRYKERIHAALEATRSASCANSEFLVHMSQEVGTPLKVIAGMTPRATKGESAGNTKKSAEKYRHGGPAATRTHP